MADILLFHSALGLRPGVLEVAKQLKAAGHTVTAPDLYKGQIFDDYEAGGKKWFAPGIPALLRQAEGLCKDLPKGLVFAGFSNGAALAQFLAGTQAGAKGALLMHGALPLDQLQLKTWPKQVPVQLHYNEHDPFRDPGNDAALQRAVEESGAPFEKFLYPGKTHLFADPDLPDYSKKSAELMMERVLRFLEEVG